MAAFIVNCVRALLIRVQFNIYIQSRISLSTPMRIDMKCTGPERLLIIIYVKRITYGIH